MNTIEMQDQLAAEEDVAPNEKQVQVNLDFKAVNFAIIDMGGFINSAAKLPVTSPDHHPMLTRSMFDTATSLLVLLSYIVNNYGFDEATINQIMAEKQRAIGGILKAD